MAYALFDELIGSQSVSNFFAPDTVQRQVLGSKISGVDNFWGGGDFIYLKANGTIPVGALAVWDLGWNAIVVPNTANTGRSVASSMFPMVAGQFGWFQISGMAAVSATASVAIATPIGITAAGQVGPNSAGKQVLNAQSAAPSTTTVVKTNALTTSGSNVITVPNADGWFVGVTISGTGIPALTTITGISPDGRLVTLNNNATASGVVSLTGTYTNFIIVQMNQPFIQGAIT
jgi:hypothetical protein